MKKVALVTGISKGIGKAVASVLLKEGFLVHGTYNTDLCGAEELLRESEGNLNIYQVDFADRAGTLEFLQNLKGINFDAVVNNAGVILFEDFDEFDFDAWDLTLQVNLTTPLLICQKLSSHINPGGAVVNVASVDGMMGTFSSMAYAASKAGLINLTKALGNVLGQRNIRVNAVAPGWVDTDMSTEASMEAGSLTPLGRNAKPEEIADLVYYLLSEKSSFVNGTTMVIDGGYTNVDTIMLKEANGEI